MSQIEQTVKIYQHEIFLHTLLFNMKISQSTVNLGQSTNKMHTIISQPRGPGAQTNKSLFYSTKEEQIHKRVSWQITNKQEAQV